MRLKGEECWQELKKGLEFALEMLHFPMTRTRTRLCHCCIKGAWCTRVTRVSSGWLG